MEAADEIKEGGTEVMLTATLDPPETGGVEAMRTGVVKIFDNSVKIAWNEGNREDAICTRMKGVMVICVC